MNHDYCLMNRELSNMAARTLETENNFETRSNSVLKDCIAGVIHPKVKLYVLEL